MQICAASDLFMDKFIINGGKPLTGEVTISGFKNAALPIIFGCILTKDKCIIENLPDIKDVAKAFDILRAMGARIEYIDEYTASIDTTDVKQGMAPAELVSKMRGSTYILGAELGAFKKAQIAWPGGCDFGIRPIDQHIKGFEAIGAKVTVAEGYVRAEADDGIIGNSVYFDTVSVGATCNLMLAAATAQGTTIIENAAREPHIVDLANFLNTCGANIKGAGTNVIKIKGVESLHGCTYAIIPDMIEAGTYMLAAVATHGSIKINNVIPKHLESISSKIEEMGVTVEEIDDSIIISNTENLKKIRVKTLPYPGFPTDMHPQMTATLCFGESGSTVTETVFENRFRYIDELKKMGADIQVIDKTAYINSAPMYGAQVRAVDLRAGAAMVIAGLAARGQTEILDIYSIERGYEGIVAKLTALGADIRKVSE